jgi:hypothetical protein
MSKVYHETNTRDKMKTFFIDPYKNKLFILYKKLSFTGLKNHHMKILELDTCNLIQELSLSNTQMIGRIKSDLFTFTDGFIYWNNNMIKIRYDLLDKKDLMLTCDQVFDFYPDIF